MVVLGCRHLRGYSNHSSCNKGAGVIYIIEIIYSLVCVLLAWRDKEKINKGLRIYHAIGGATHITAAVLTSIFFGWWTGFMILLIARIVFNTALNLFRGLPVDYVSTKPLAITDRIEKSIFGNDGIFPLVIYLVALIVLNIFYAVQN